MPVTADTHVQLGVSSPKKSATVDTGTLTLGANEVAIKIGSAVPSGQLGNPQLLVGSFEKLFRFAKSFIKDYTGDTVFSIPPGGGDGDIVTTGHTTALLSLYVDAAVIDGDKSHFLNRTFRRCIERLLEESK
jgi:hypothetical protein